MYKLTTYLKNLPQQSVSSKRNLQVVDPCLLDETDCCGMSLRYVVSSMFHPKVIFKSITYIYKCIYYIHPSRGFIFYLIVSVTGHCRYGGLLLTSSSIKHTSIVILISISIAYRFQQSETDGNAFTSSCF